MAATRVLFLAQGEQDWWMLNSVYRACQLDSRWSVCVVDVGFAGWHELDTVTGPLLERLGIPYVDGRRDAGILTEFKPDLILVTSPYDEYRPAAYASARLAELARIVYFPYGVDFCGGDGFLQHHVFGEAAQQAAWRIITRSTATIDNYVRLAGKQPHQIAPLGLPVLDHYYDSEQLDGVPDRVIEASEGKRKILYTPHHSVNDWSTFLQFGPQLRDALLANDDCYMIFRPHPGLAYALDSQGYMSTDEFRDFFPSNRSYLQDCDEFNGAFRWSDFLISDASSMLGQYAPTRKPIIYTTKPDGPGLEPSFDRDIRDSYYVAASAHELDVHLNALLSGADPMHEQRFEVQARMINGVFSADTGARIVEYLADEVKSS